MHIRDISKPVTARDLNESLQSRFGKRVRLEDFSLDQLYNARNKLRTSLSQIETNESYNAVNTSEAYQKNRLFLDVLNAEINEREEVQVNEKAESEAQQKAAGAALAAKRGEIPVSDLKGASKEMYKMSEKDLEDFAGTKHKCIPAKKESVTSEGAADTKAKMKQIVSTFKPISKSEKVVKAFSYKPGKDFESIPVIITKDPKVDEESDYPYALYIKSDDSNEMFHHEYYDNMETAISDAKFEIKDKINRPSDNNYIPGQQRLPFEEDFDRVPPEDHNDLDHEGGMALKQLSTIDDAADELRDCLKTDENLPEWVQKKIVLAMSYIDTARDYMKSAKDVDRERGMSMESIIREGAEDQAEIVMAAKNMVDKITSWMEDTAEMQTESMLDLNDSIRDELGENEAQQFTDTVKPALESLYGSLEETRQTLVKGVQLVAGEEVADMPGDTEDDLEVDTEMEPTVDQDEGLPAPEDDEFAAADAAVGGEEEAGREKRESIERTHRLASILSSKKK